MLWHRVPWISSNLCCTGNYSHFIVNNRLHGGTPDSWPGLLCLKQSLCFSAGQSASSRFSTVLLFSSLSPNSCSRQLPILLNSLIYFFCAFPHLILSPSECPFLCFKSRKAKLKCYFVYDILHLYPNKNLWFHLAICIFTLLYFTHTRVVCGHAWFPSGCRHIWFIFVLHECLT